MNTTDFDATSPDQALAGTAGFHEVGKPAALTGAVIVGGGAAGAVIGGAVAGPIGAAIGAIIGAVAGGAAAAEEGESTSAKPYEPLMVPPTHEQIADRAWQYYEAEGKTDGHHFEDWIRAESDLYREALAARDAADS